MLLRTDIGIIRAHVITVVLDEEFTEDDLEHLVRLRNSCPGALLIACNASRVTGARHVIYALYIALRNSLHGVSVARDPNVEAIALMMGKTQFKPGLEEAKPTGSRYVVIGILGMGECVDEVEVRVRELIRLRHPRCCLIVGAGAVKAYAGPWASEQDALEEIIEANVELIAHGRGSRSSS